MSRRRASKLGSLVVGVASIASLAGLITAVHARRESAHERYQDAQNHQARQIGRALPAPAPAEPQPKTDLCVGGVDSFATALARLHGATASAETAKLPLAANKGRRRLLAAFSDAAIRAERFAEQAHPAPTLPKRMGSTASGETRLAIEPKRTSCGGTAFAEAPLGPIDRSGAPLPTAP